MIEVSPGIFVGSQSDYDGVVSRQSGWAVVHACKEPYHRAALGYTTKSAPREHPEYLVAPRGNRLMLNIVDAPRPEFFDMGMLRQALDFIDEARAQGLRVLIHCNQGESRGPSIALLYLATRLHALPDASFEAAEAAFRQVYPFYAPKQGIREHLRLNWNAYTAS